MNTKIRLKLTELGVRKFRQIPTFNRLLHQNQINILTVGINILYVNPTVLGSIKRVVDYDSSNMTLLSNFEE